VGFSVLSYSQRLLVTYRPLLNSLRPTFNFDGRDSTLRTDAIQQDAGWFVSRVLRHEFAPECLGEDGLVEMIDQFAGAGCLGREAVNPGKSSFHAAAVPFPALLH